MGVPYTSRAIVVIVVDDEVVCGVTVCIQTVFAAVNERRPVVMDSAAVVHVFCFVQRRRERAGDAAATSGGGPRFCVLVRFSRVHKPVGHGRMRSHWFRRV